MKSYDPSLAALIMEIYGDNDWQNMPIATRTHLPHLQGFNPQDSPTFEWPKDLEDAFAQLMNPYSDGGDEWVNLGLYHPSQLSQLNLSRTRDNRTEVLFVNPTEVDVLVYRVHPDGMETFIKRIPAKRKYPEFFGTDAGNIFLVKDFNGRHLALFRAEEKTGRVLIDTAPIFVMPGLSKMFGDNQKGLSSTALANPFVIELRDESSSVLQGISVTFVVTTGGGTLSVTHTTTNASGRAQSTLTLGPNLGTNTIEVSAAGIENTVMFNAVAGPEVAIPDPNLRTAIETTLGKAAGERIAPSEMSTLTELNARDASISNLTGLEFATNLTTLRLHNNHIIDISALSSLTDLDELYLDNNNIADISALSGLIHLRGLGLGGNRISDTSALSSLTQLKKLRLGSNSISDIPALSSLTRLTELWLGSNNISGLSPLVTNTGLGSGDTINVKGNPLSYQSIHTHIRTLHSRGVTVEFDNRIPAIPLKISGDNQQGAPGATLEQPFVVEVRDRNSEAFAGVPVTFAIIEGGGTLSVTNTITDENGRAQSTLTLGSDRRVNAVRVTIEGISKPVTFTALAEIEFNLSVPVGISLIHVPLKVTAVDGVAQTITSIADLYDALGGASRVNFLITYDSHTQEWRSYFGISDTGTPADRALTDDMGIIAGMTTPASIRLSGSPLGTDGSSTITLNQGLNLVGLPLRDSGINRVSHLFTLDGIGGNVPVIILTDGGEFKAVGRAGDPGDIPITGGQAFIMTAQQPATVTLSGDGWYNTSGAAAAPLVRNADLHSLHTGIKVKDTTPVLALKGSIVDEETGINQVGIRVTVKNLATNRKVVTVTGEDEVGYRLTVVDIETGRAATIGAILEISAQSPYPFIGLQPLWYTVTAEDVRQSLIQLPALVAYEIPAETELLANYPNPFNPETWIPYRLAEDAFVTLTIYDLSGQIVRTFDIGHRIAAAYENQSKAVYWDGRNDVGERVASSVYFYTLMAGDYSATRKMVILK